MRVLDGQQGYRAGKKHLIQIIARRLVQIIHRALAAGFIVGHGVIRHAGAGQIGKRIRLHGQRRIAVVQPVIGPLQRGFAVVIPQRNAHLPRKILRRGHKGFLPPVRVGSIVAVQRKGAEQIDLGHAGRKLLAHGLCQLFVVQGRIPARRGHEIVFVRDQCVIHMPGFSF